MGIAAVSGAVWVGDDVNARAVRFSGPPFTNGESESTVIGQSSFTSPPFNGIGTCDTAGTGFAPDQSHVCGAEGVAVDPTTGFLWLSDTVNNRILGFAPPFTNGESATTVIGQASFFTNLPASCTNVPPTEFSLCDPGGITFDSGGNLWVADRENSRVLEFKAPLSTGEAASVVFGQGTGTLAFTGHACTTSPATQSGLCRPEGVAIDPSGNLWVSDTRNNRVLKFSLSPPITNGELASAVIGQPGYTSVTCNIATPNGLCVPIGIALDSSGNLWVADTENNRVIKFPAPFINGESAATAIGQPSLSSNGCADNPATQNGLCQPEGVAIDPSGNLWVSDWLNDRVLEFTTATVTSTVTSTITSTITSSSTTTSQTTTGQIDRRRMTGGGSVTDPNGVKVTFGFELHCDISIAPNKLEINWNGNHFHLDTLTSATCSNDPGFSSSPPDAGFNTFKGTGTGTLNGVPGSTITFTFTDHGEPGTSDTAMIMINGGATLSVSGTLDNGNIQAHAR